MSYQFILWGFCTPEGKEGSNVASKDGWFNISSDKSLSLTQQKQQVWLFKCPLIFLVKHLDTLTQTYLLRMSIHLCCDVLKLLTPRCLPLKLWKTSTPETTCCGFTQVRRFDVVIIGRRSPIHYFTTELISVQHDCWGLTLAADTWTDTWKIQTFKLLPSLPFPH